MKTMHVLFALVGAGIMIAWPHGAQASGCSSGVSAAAGQFGIHACVHSDSKSPTPTGKNSTSQGSTQLDTAADSKIRYEMRPICVPRATNSAGQPTSCATTTTCRAGLFLYELWIIDPVHGESSGGLRCLTKQVAGQNPPRNSRPARPQVTPAMVLRAFRQVPVPTSTSVAQPAGRTLVNFDTIFHTTADPFTRQVTLLGQNVTLDIHATRFDWTWGDGTQSSTTVPGAPYPAKQVVHRYPHAHTTVRHHVTVTWGATYSVGDGPQQDVPGTVTRAGPPTGLHISEATPALSGQGH